MRSSIPASSQANLTTEILSDIVKRFSNLKEATARRPLLIKHPGSMAPQVINDLLSRYLIKRKDPSTEEEYLPHAAAFEFCGDAEIRERAKLALGIVLHTVQNMFIGEEPNKGFELSDLKWHVEKIYNKAFDDELLKLGLYLALDFEVLGGLRMNPDNTEVTWFQISERAITTENLDAQWDLQMAKYRTETRQPSTPTSGSAHPQNDETAKWERIKPLGSGGTERCLLGP